jgi:hypothetical protein
LRRFDLVALVAFLPFSLVSVQNFIKKVQQQTPEMKYLSQKDKQKNLRENKPLSVRALRIHARGSDFITNR